MSELNLIIIWENARYKEEGILSDISKNFKILNCYDIAWSKEHFSNNMTRFYGQKLPQGSHKEKHCGTGRFLLITFLDLSPKYEERQTSKGPEKVNVNLFDKKELYRSWTGGGHKVHSTNGIHETAHDLMLLLGVTIDEYILSFQDAPFEKIQFLDKDLEGAALWNNFEQIFKVINVCSNYVIMRNFEQLPKKYNVNEHGDIDFLVDNRIDFSYIVNGSKSKDFFRPFAYSIQVGTDIIPCDFREVGDGYYDPNWQQAILKDTCTYNGFEVPSQGNYLAMLVYHALIHKKSIVQDYVDIFKQQSIDLDKLKPFLTDFMKKNQYEITIPEDLSVYFNFKISSSLGTNKFSLLRFLRQFFCVELRVFASSLLKRK